MRKIGGTAMATLKGANPFQSKKALYLYLTGEIDSFEENAAMEWGKRLEPLIIQKFREDHPKMKIGESEISVVHEKYDFIVGRPDRPILHPAEGHIIDGLEAKTCSPWNKDGFGDDGTDEIPGHYRIQCNHYMGLCEVEQWHLAVLIGGSDYREYVLDFDEELYENCIETAVEFWNSHVIPRIAPKDDRPDETVRKYLAKKYQIHDSEIRKANDYENTLISGLSAAYAKKKEGEYQYDLIAQKLIDSIKEKKGITSDLGKIGITRGQKTITDWKSVAQSLAPPKDLIEGFTKESDPFSFVATPRDWSKQVQSRLENGVFVYG